MPRPTSDQEVAELSARERTSVKNVVITRHLCGLANDTKWEEFFSAIRRETWSPKSLPDFRFKRVDAAASTWTADWWHTPMVSASIEWWDVRFVEEVRDNRLPQNIEVVDHSPRIESILRSVGFDYIKGTQMFRIFGYSPKDLTLFDA
jgi:hypothetical protein